MTDPVTYLSALTAPMVAALDAAEAAQRGTGRTKRALASLREGDIYVMETERDVSHATGPIARSLGRKFDRRTFVTARPSARGLFHLADALRGRTLTGQIHFDHFWLYKFMRQHLIDPADREAGPAGQLDAFMQEMARRRPQAGEKIQIFEPGVAPGMPGPRAPFQCAHCGLIAHSPAAREIHFGATPDQIPLCLAPVTAQALLFQLRMIAVNEHLGWTADLPKLVEAAEAAVAAASPDAPRSRKPEAKAS